MAASFLATRRTLGFLLSRRSRISVPVFLHRHNHQQHEPLVDRSASQTRFSSSLLGYSPLDDPSANWPPEETILADGCDYEHWLIVMEFDSDPKPTEEEIINSDPKPTATEEEMINTYVRTLAYVVGSEEEAKKKIYSVCTSTYTGFGALISEEQAYKVKCLPGVLWVIPDSYLDVPNKDYGGDLLVDGKIVHRPQYRFNEGQNTSRLRPRYNRRRETVMDSGLVQGGDAEDGLMTVEELERCSMEDEVIEEEY